MGKTRRLTGPPSGRAFRLPNVQEFGGEEGTLQDRTPRAVLEGIEFEASENYPIPFVLEVVRDVIAVQQTNYNATDWNAVTRLISEIESGLNSDGGLDIARLGEYLIRLGMVYQRITVRTAESDVKRGKKVIQGARAAHVHTHGTADTKERRWSEMNNQVLTHLRQGMGVDCDQEVSRYCGLVVVAGF